MAYINSEVEAVCQTIEDDLHDALLRAKPQRGAILGAEIASLPLDESASSNLELRGALQRQYEKGGNQENACYRFRSDVLLRKQAV